VPAQFNGEIAASSILIRPPHEAEWPVCRMLLPAAFELGSAPECLLALDPDRPKVFAAAAYRVADRVMFALRIRVIRIHRRRGIGARLMEALLTVARRHDVREILVPVDVNTEPDADGFLTAYGFHRTARLTKVDAPAGPMHQYLQRIEERLLQRRMIPPDARFVWLPDAPHGQLLHLFAEYIVHNPDFQPEGVRNAIRRGMMDSSPVLMIDDRVEGMILWERRGELAEVHARVVTPRFQGGWVNAMLLARGLGRAWKEGVRRVRFEFEDGNRDTRKLAARFRAVTVWVRDTYKRELVSSSQTGEEGR